MVIRSAMILGTCFAIATTEDSQDSTKHFYWLKSTNCCKASCMNHLQGVLHWVVLEKNCPSVATIAAELYFHNDCWYEKCEECL